MLEGKTLSPEVRALPRLPHVPLHLHQYFSLSIALRPTTNVEEPRPLWQVSLQLQVMGTGRTTMIDASPKMTATRLSRVIEKQTGVPRGSFALYHASKPMCGTLEESGVASGSTVELKFRGRGGGPEPQAANSFEVEIETNPPAEETSEAAALGRSSRRSMATKVMRSYDKDGDGKFSKDEVHAMAADFLKEKKTRRLATRAAIAMGVLILLVVGLNAGLTAAIVFLSKDVKVANGKLVDSNTNEELRMSSTDTMISDEGELVDRKHGTALKTAESERELALDSRLPDSAWVELRHVTIHSQEGGMLHVHIQVQCTPLFPCTAKKQKSMRFTLGRPSRV